LILLSKPAVRTGHLMRFFREFYDDRKRNYFLIRFVPAEDVYPQGRTAIPVPEKQALYNTVILKP
jgi:hypothetical protein